MKKVEWNIISLFSVLRYEACCPAVCPFVCSVTSRSWDKLQILNFLFVFLAEWQGFDQFKTGLAGNDQTNLFSRWPRGLMTGNKGLVDYNTAIHHDWLVNTMAGFCWILTIQTSLLTDMHTSPHQARMYRVYLRSHQISNIQQVRYSQYNSEIFLKPT